MKPIEIIVIIVAVVFVVTVFGIRIYKKINHKPLDDCSECHKRMIRAVNKMKKDSKKISN